MQVRFHDNEAESEPFPARFSASYKPELKRLLDRPKSYAEHLMIEEISEALALLISKIFHANFFHHIVT